MALLDTVLPEKYLARDEKTGVQVPRVYLPRRGVDLTRWAVVACDQYTSQPEYWERVAQFVDESPSTLHLTFPEVYLGAPDEEQRIRKIQDRMEQYLEDGLLEAHDNFIYVERQAAGKTRKGILVSLDLEMYDYTPGSQSLIRATEGTIVDRLPPRMKIRQGAALELPHILVLIDDPEGTVIEPLSGLARAGSGSLEKAYDFDLMMDSGHLTGYRVVDREVEAGIFQALENLADPRVFAPKYGVSPKSSPLLFAVGDGNHSLATAKAVWEKMKPSVGMDHPARYALVEIENVHDRGLEFEPIHRVAFDLKVDLFEALKNHYSSGFTYTAFANCDEMIDFVESPGNRNRVFGVVINQRFGAVEIHNPACNLAVGNLQPFLDGLVQSHQVDHLDYVHGQCVVCKLADNPENIGFFLPHMDKHDLFKTVILDGALPRKTFSMGEAREKRFYMEARRIS